MSAPLFEEGLPPYQSWVRAMADAVCNHWELANAQYHWGMTVLQALRSGPWGTAGGLAKPGDTASLEARAQERMRQGLPPPREIYDVQNRGRIDWTTVPDWARPVDPELFEGCGHEG
jgi:hypothetical protein